MKTTKLTLLLLIATMFCSCYPEMEVVEEQLLTGELENELVPTRFNWETTHQVYLEVEVFDGQRPLVGTRIEVYTCHYESGAKKIAVGGIDNRGLFKFTGVVPTKLASVFIKAHHLGLVNTVEAPIVGNRVMGTLNVQPTTANQLLSTKKNLSLNKTYITSQVNQTHYSHICQLITIEEDLII